MRTGPRSVHFVVVLTAVVAAAITALSPARAVAHAPHANGIVGGTASPATGGQPIAFGADLKPAKKQTLQQTIASFETITGRKLAYTRDYLLWDSPFPTDYEEWLGARGTVPFISVSPHTLANATISWSSIANATPGSQVYAQMVNWADEVKAFGYPIYFTFNHEPEAASSEKYGTAPDFIAAWQNFHRVFDAEHVANARWIWTMTAYAFTVPSSDRRWGPKWYPGDAYVDALGADAYTAYTCDNGNGIWHNLAYQIAGFTAFGAQHPSKPLWLPEWGVVEDPNQPGRKAQFIAEAQALFKGSAYQQYAGIAYFDETRPGTACVWDVTSSTTAQTAYNTMAGDSFYSGSAAWTPGDTTPPTVAITSPANDSTLSGSTTVTAMAADNLGVANVAFFVDGTAIGTTSAAPYTATVNAATLSAGPHSLTALATDTTGNQTMSSAVQVTVSSSAPSTQCPATPTGNTELSTNLSVESNQAGWTGIYNTNSQNTRVKVNGGSYDGNWAIQITPKSGLSGVAGLNNVSPFWVADTVAGRTYTGSAMVRSSVSGVPATVLLRETTTAGTGVSYASKTVTLSGTGWQPITVAYAAKNAGDQIRYSLYANFPAAGTSMLGDCLSLQSAP